MHYPALTGEVNAVQTDLVVRMWTKARFQNFKGFRYLELGLEPFTVVAGPNASGKTSILEGLHSLSQFCGAPPQKFL